MRVMRATAATRAVQPKGWIDIKKAFNLCIRAGGHMHQTRSHSMFTVTLENRLIAMVCVVVVVYWIFFAVLGVQAAARPYMYAEDERRFPVTGAPELTLTSLGAIEVRGWDRPEVLVAIQQYGFGANDNAKAEIRTEQQGNRITVEAKLKNADSAWWRLPRYVTLIVSVPKASHIVATSTDGAVNVSDVAGELNLRSDEGAIRGHGLTGVITARTGDGSIDLDAIDGSADLGADDGNIRLEGHLNRVRIRSGDGRVTVRAEPGSNVESDWNIRTDDGSVVLDLDAGFAANVDARSADGRIHADGLPKNPSNHAGEKQHRYMVGGGGRSVRVRTGDGSITIRQ